MPKRQRPSETPPVVLPLPMLGQTVFPGDELCLLSALSSAAAATTPSSMPTAAAPGPSAASGAQPAPPPPPPILLGAGVVRDGADLLRSSRVGILRWDGSRCRVWVEGEARRYIPALNDHVIGIVDSKHAEEYRLHIGGPALASLPVLAFDGATKRNRPHLEVGALIYARVTLAHRDMEPEVSCAAPPGVGAKDWVTKESVFGELSGGYVFDCPPLLCRRLMGLDETSPVLDALGALAPFELAVGANGRVWISSSSAAMVVLSQAAILRSQGVADEDHSKLVDELAERFEISPEHEQAA
jgi:exosome complex component RRP40